MKVLHLLYELKFSGAEVMYADAASLFQSLGCELGVVATASQIGEFAPVMERAGYTVYHLPYPNGYISRFIYYRYLCKLIRREKYDVVHVHTSALRWGGAFCAWLTGCRCVSTFHSTFPTHWYSRPWHIWLRMTAKYIFGARFQSISDSVCQNEKRRFLNNTKLVYNWYGCNRFFPAAEGEKANARKQLGIKNDAIVVVSVAGCREMKRHCDIIHAVNKIVAKCPQILYLHVGSGGYEKHERQLVAELGLDDYVMFCGAQQDVRRFLIASDIYLMTSRYEGIPITTIEAMACRIPCILYNVSGLRDFNNEEQCSLLIPENIDVLAEKIMELKNDGDLRDRLSAKAEALVHRKYFMEHNARQIYKMYQ